MGMTSATPGCQAGAGAKASSTSQSMVRSGFARLASLTAGRVCNTSPSDDVLITRILIDAGPRPGARQPGRFPGTDLPGSDDGPADKLACCKGCSRGRGAAPGPPDCGGRCAPDRMGRTAPPAVDQGLRRHASGPNHC